MTTIVFCICITLVFICYIIVSHKERMIYIELIASKDYADYKNFENRNITNGDHSNMFTMRESKIKRNDELE